MSTALGILSFIVGVGLIIGGAVSEPHQIWMFVVGGLLTLVALVICVAKGGGAALTDAIGDGIGDLFD